MAGRYGFGFAFIPSAAPRSFLQYGPDGLGPAYMNYVINVHDDGITLANVFTCGWAGRRLCISWDGLLRVIMALHYQDIYEFAEDIYSTWASIPDWTAPPEDLPLWVRTGEALQS